MEISGITKKVVNYSHAEYLNLNSPLSRPSILPNYFQMLGLPDTIWTRYLNQSACFGVCCPARMHQTESLDLLVDAGAFSVVGSLRGMWASGR